MTKSSKQETLPLDLSGDGLASAQPMSVRVTSGKPARHLTRNQKKFSQLLAEIEKLRARQQRVTTIWENFLAAYLKRIHPEEQRQHDLRKSVVRRLAAHWHKPKGLGPRQRESLADLIQAQLACILDHEPDLADSELLALVKHFEEHATARRKLNGHDMENDDLPLFVAEIIRESGLDPSKFRGGMTPDEIQTELERQMQTAGGAPDDFADEDLPPPPPRKRQGKGKTSAPDPRVQAAQAEEARKRTIATIYKQLAKVLHPDLENDPTRREQKHHLMQELTTAYRQGDLHTLLRLELAWIHREDGDLDRLTDEKLKIYIQLLHEQVADLHEEVHSIFHAPRFAVVSRFTDPFTGEPEQIDTILDDLVPLTQSLETSLAELAGPGARTTLRAIIKDYTREQKSADRFPDFIDFGY